MKEEENPLHEEIMDLLIKRAKRGDNINEYINPEFLAIITATIFDYYELENMEVEDWISDMYSA